jgi:hypothetical protein
LLREPRVSMNVSGVHVTFPAKFIPCKTHFIHLCSSPLQNSLVYVFVITFNQTKNKMLVIVLYIQKKQHINEFRRGQQALDLEAWGKRPEPRTGSARVWSKSERRNTSTKRPHIQQNHRAYSTFQSPYCPHLHRLRRHSLPLCGSPMPLSRPALCPPPPPPLPRLPPHLLPFSRRPLHRPAQGSRVFLVCFLCLYPCMCFHFSVIVAVVVQQ